MAGDGWPSAAVDIISGDLCAAFAYTTRFGGVSVAPVCPFGIHDTEAGTISTSVPLGFADKLARLAEAPEAALAFFRRDHGRSTTPGFVLAQGVVTFPDAVPPGHLDALHERWEPFLGKVPEGGLVRKLGGDAYYDARLPVTLHVRRLRYWSDRLATEGLELAGEPAPSAPPPQTPPKRGTAPIVPAAKLAKQLRRDEDHLLGYVDGDGLPVVLPVTPGLDGDALAIDRPDLPAGGRRASLLGFWYRRELHGQGMVTARGWLDAGDGEGAPATFAVSGKQAFNLALGAFGQKVLVPIALAFQYRSAVKAGRVRDGAFVRPG